MPISLFIFACDRYTLGDRSGELANISRVTARKWNIGLWGPLITSSIAFIYCFIISGVGFLTNMGVANFGKKMIGLRGTDWMWASFMVVSSVNGLMVAQAAGITEIWEFSAIMLICFLFNMVLFQSRRGKHPGPVFGAFLCYALVWIDIFYKWYKAHTDLEGGDYNSTNRMWFIGVLSAAEALRLVFVVWAEFVESSNNGFTGRSKGRAYLEYHLHTFFFVGTTAFITIMALVGGIYYPYSDPSISTA